MKKIACFMKDVAVLVITLPLWLILNAFSKKGYSFTFFKVSKGKYYTAKKELEIIKRSTEGLEDKNRAAREEVGLLDKFCNVLPVIWDYKHGKRVFNVWPEHNSLFESIPDMDWVRNNLDKVLFVGYDFIWLKNLAWAADFFELKYYLDSKTEGGKKQYYVELCDKGEER